MDAELYKLLIPALNIGLWHSVKVIIPSAVLGLALGLVLGGIRAVGPPRLAALGHAYVSIFRGTPLVVQLMVWYYGLPNLAMWARPFFEDQGWPALWKVFYLSPYAASVCAFVCCGGAYHSEYIRGAILSIRRGQFQAASALGFTRVQAFRSIVAPQAIRRAWPGCGNELIYLIKYSSLAFIATYKDLMAAGKTMTDYYFHHIEIYMTVALYYLFLVTLATWLFRRVERALAIPGLGAA